MKPSNRMSFVATVLILATLACNIPQSQAPAQDPNAAVTAAVQTVSAQLTQAAAQNQVQPSATAISSATSTFTQIPAVTIQPPATVFVPSATSASSCDAALFVADVSIPDNTVMTPGEDFTKTWRLKNTGTCTWSTSYDVVFSSGNQMGAVSEQALTGSVAPGQTIDISVNMTAPATNGTYTGNWKLRNASGVGFTTFYVQIKVEGGGSGGSPAFAVTSVTYSVSGSCGGFHIVAHITTNGPGTVEYYWVFNGNDPVEGTYGSTLTFSAAGTKNTPVLDWYISAPGTHFAQVYIDSPNNQYIGKAFVSCP